MVGLELSIKNSGLDVDRKIWEYGHLPCIPDLGPDLEIRSRLWRVLPFSSGPGVKNLWNTGPRVTFPFGQKQEPVWLFLR